MSRLEDIYCIRKLKDNFTSKKRGNLKYSLRSFADHLGVHPGSLSSILNGKRKIPLKWAIKLAQKLELSFEEEKLFFKSVKYQQQNQKISTWSEMKLNEEETTLLNEELHYKVLSEWEYYAFLSLMNVSDFDPTPQWVSHRLNLTSTRVAIIIENLITLNLIRWENNNLVRNYGRLDTSHNIPSEALKKGYRELLEIAKKKIDEVDVELRGFFSETMPIDIRKVDKAKDLIIEFKGKFSNLLSQGETSEVYNLDIQFYPLTTIFSNHKEITR